jgi:hypothetical protein
MQFTLFSVFISSLLVRILVSRRHEPTFDVYGHLLFAKTVNMQKAGPFGRINLNVLGNSGYDHPFMWHWIVGHCNPESLLRHQAWLNGIIDSLFIVSASWFSMRSGFSEEVTLYAAAIYIFSPLWFSNISIGPRIAGFTPRLSSEVAANLFFMICLLPIGFSRIQIVLVGGILVAFILSSSKFGVQALFFLTPLISLMSGNLIPLITFLMGLSIAVLVSRFRLIQQMRSQIAHLVWYYRANQRRDMPVSERNSFRLLFKRSEIGTKEYLIKLAARAARDNSYTALLIKLPAILIVIYAMLIPQSNHGSVNDHELLSAAIAAGIVFMAVNHPNLLFLGEAERYFNHVAYPIALYVAQYGVVAKLHPMINIIIAYGALYWIIEALVMERFEPRHFRLRAIENLRVIEDLKSLPQTNTILCYPFGAAGGIFRIMLETKHRTVYPLLAGKEFSRNFNEKYTDKYPFVKLEKIDAMASEHGISYLVIDRKVISARGGELWKPSHHWVKRHVGGEYYDVYQKLG